MLIEFSVVPMGTGASVSAAVARILKLVMESGMPYRANPMGTVVEGDWSRLMELVHRCHDEALTDADRVITTIKIDDFKGRDNRIEKKLESVEQKLGMKLNR